MIEINLSDVYRDYIACLNKQDWPKLEQFVHDKVCYNGQQIGLLGYGEMLERDFHEIPDLYFNIELLISDPPYMASRLKFQGNRLNRDEMPHWQDSCLTPGPPQWSQSGKLLTSPPFSA